MIFASIAFRGCLNRGEYIKFVAHVHPFITYTEFFKLMFLGIALPLGFNLIIPPFKIVWLVWLVIGIWAFVYELFNWYLDAWIITNMSIIDYQWDGFFKKSSTRIDYNTIEGVTYTIQGFWATIMNYGDIMVERMGSGTVVTLKNVAFPKQVEREVLKNQADFMKNKNLKDQTVLRDLLVSMVQDKKLGK
jgi:hypothetical protein